MVCLASSTLLIDYISLKPLNYCINSDGLANRGLLFFQTCLSLFCSDLRGFHPVGNARNIYSPVVVAKSQYHHMCDHRFPVLIQIKSDNPPGNPARLRPRLVLESHLSIDDRHPVEVTDAKYLQPAAVSATWRTCGSAYLVHSS